MGRDYDHRMSDNVFGIESARTLDGLARALGGIAECKRLGFAFEDENGVMRLSVAGMGYLLRVAAVDVTSLAEAFAAGYACAKEDG